MPTPSYAYGRDYHHVLLTTHPNPTNNHLKIIYISHSTTFSVLRHVHTMKIMHIGSKLICIVCVHTECTLTKIHFECIFSQSTPIGGLKLVWRWIASWCEIVWVLHIRVWYRTVKTLAVKKRWQIWWITVIHQVFFANFH